MYLILFFILIALAIYIQLQHSELVDRLQKAGEKAHTEIARQMQKTKEVYAMQINLYRSEIQRLEKENDQLKNKKK